MNNNLILKRVDNPEGHQVCQVDRLHRTVAIQNKRYRTLIHFAESGEVNVRHERIKKDALKEAANR